MSNSVFFKSMATSILFLSLSANTSVAEVLFNEDFDDQPDWTADEIFIDNNNLLNFNTLQNWHFGISRPTFSPKTGYPTKRPVAEVLGSNTDKTKTGTGKSAVFWRESVQGGQFNSDSLQVYYFPEGYNELYVEFYITLSNELIQAYYDGGIGQTKIFRVYYFNGDETALSDFFGDENKPSYNWDLSGSRASGYGVRNFSSFLARGPNDMSGIIQGLPTRIQGNGDVSLSYSPTATDGNGVGGTNPVLTDYKNGGAITSGPVDVDQVFGDETQWVKMAFYVKMNSAPGVADGEQMQWLDGQRIVHTTNIPWVRAGFNMVKWNSIGIGGNAQFNIYPTALQREDWYAIDDIVVRDDIPSYLDKNQVSPPGPPAPVKVE